MNNIKFFKNQKKLFFTLFTFLLTFIFIFNFTEIYAALGDPKLISKLSSAFETIESWLLKISTPAAAVAVGTGVFMKKFSFGDEERIRIGKRFAVFLRVHTCNRFNSICY